PPTELLLSPFLPPPATTQLSTLSLHDALPISTTRDTGSIYRIVAPSAFASKPAGQWNDLWILCDGDHVRVTMNGRRIIDTRMSEDRKSTRLNSSHVKISYAVFCLKKKKKKNKQ